MDIKKALLLCLLLIPSLVFAHGGRTDKNGCHQDTAAKYSHTTSAKPQYLTAQFQALYSGAQILTGYSACQADGVLGNQTVKAIKHFQVDNEMTVDGKPSYLLLEVLLGKVR
jgi:hypothetical protein